MRRDTVLAFLLILLFVGALAMAPMLVSANDDDRAAGGFDAARAKARLAFLLGDERPHPADSPTDDDVRARLVETLRGMGLEPVVRDQMACNDFAASRLVACARVRNVVARLGPQKGSALLLSAHYDSVPVGPGAADDGIGVATLLEVGSILRHRPIRRPILLLFNEGEELGLIGARAFLADPLSHNVDSLLNFEARGVDGPVTMFETNDPNGAAVEVYSRAVRRKFASSLSTDVARLIPNSTDVTTFKERGWTTLNSAIVGNETRYHSPGDNLAALDPRSLKDMGEEALALSTDLSSGAPHASGNRAFVDIASRVFLDLPLRIALGWLALLTASFGYLALRRRAVVAAAFATTALVGASAMSWIAVSIMAFLRSGAYWRAHPSITWFAIGATTLVCVLAAFRKAGQRCGVQQMRAGYWFIFLLTGGLLSALAPGGVIYFLAPPSLVLVGIILARWFPPAEIIGGLMGTTLIYLTFGELVAALEELFSPGPLWVIAPFMALILASALVECIGIIKRANGRILLPGALAVALASWTIVGNTPAYSQDRQQRFTIEHVFDTSSGKSWWSISNDGARLPAEYARLGHWHRGEMSFSDAPRWIAAAPGEPTLHAPIVKAVEISASPNSRTLELGIVANGAERIVFIVPGSAHIRSAGWPGFIRPFGENGSSANYRISCTGRSCDGSRLSITLADPNPVRLTVVSSRSGLPITAGPLINARPRFSRPQYVPDQTVTVSNITV